MTNNKNSGASAPLRGIRVLDLARFLPGPVATMHLADMGAEVIKIEDADAGDYARTMGPVRNVVSQFFVAVNRGKHIERMNLKDLVQRERLLLMVENADVLVESFGPGVIDRLGLGWKVLSLRNPKLVMCAISGYGKDGLFAQLARHDISYIACAGMLEQNACPDGRPTLPKLQIGDLPGGAQTALQRMLAALVAVKMGDAGRFVLSILQSQTRCWLITSCRWWQSTIAVKRAAKVATSLRPGRAVQVELDAVFAQQTMLEWSARLAASDCCVGPVLRMEEALRHPPFQRRNMVVQEKHPTEGRFWAASHPIRFSL